MNDIKEPAHEAVQDSSLLRRMCKTDITGYDYKTSTGVGHKHRPPNEVPYEVGNFTALKFQHQVNQVVKNDTFKTCYSNDFGWKYNDCDPNDKARVVSGSSLLFIKPYAEYLKGKPPNPQRTAITEYKRAYPNHVDATCKGEIVDLLPKYHCKLSSLEKDAQMASYPEGEGAIQHLDPYNSTTHIVHHNINKREADFYKSPPIDVSPILSPRIRPVYDKSVFRLPFLNKIVHTPPRFVPHTGLQSETSSSFRLPLDEFVTFGHGVEYPAALHKASKAEIFTVPAMYHTEYSHLNNSWPINCVINQSDQEVGIVSCEPVSQNDVVNVSDCFVRK